GKAHYKYLYGKTYAEVKSKKNQFLLYRQYSTLDCSSSENDMTLDQLFNSWLLSVKPNVKESTYAKYVFAIKRHILPELGGELVSALSTEMIEQFKQYKLNCGKLNGEGGLSPKTVTDLLSIIKLVLKFGAERNCVCSENIVIHYPKSRSRKIEILSIYEQERLERQIIRADKSYMIGIMISLHAGLRIGEVCALRWEDISFYDKILNVERTIMRIQETDYNAENKTKIIIERPKTDCSIRKIPLPDYFISWLKQHRKKPEAYIVTGTTRYIEPRNYYLKYKSLMESCGLGRYNYHALRHTFATRCVERGFDVKSLSEILGHSDVGITMKRYVHPSLELKRNHMERLQSPSFCSQNCGQ
ncbi:MAG: site-specific integrase, partial [Lachnospiraceae bacterium]|nr:site-specific integrase [Lachnospiraceae bacterium]